MLDFEKAYRICEEHPSSTIYAGLAEDWGCTAGVIWKDGKPFKDYCYLSSYWATPVVVVEGEDPIDCFKQDDGTALSNDDWLRFCSIRARGIRDADGTQEISG